jgi:superfamily II DNA or RNA helicase
MKFNIIRSNGLIKIQPFNTEILEELSFFYKYRAKIKKSFFDKRIGKIREILVDGPLKVIKKNLYSFTKDQTGIITHDGLLPRVKNYLDLNSHEYEVENIGDGFAKPVITDRVYEGLYPDQKCAVELMLSQDGGCMIEAATNTGKTRIIASICRAYKGKKGIVVTNRQSVAIKLYKDLIELSPESNPGVYLSTAKKSGDTMVITSSSLDKFNPESIDYIIYDEAHGAGSEVRSQNLLNFKGAVRYGLSATLGGGFKGIDKYLESIFGPIVFSLTDQQLEAMNRATPLHVHVMDITTGPAFSSGTQSLTMERNGVWFNRQRNKLIKECVDICPPDQQLVIYVRTYTHLEELMYRYLDDSFKVFHGKLPAKEKKKLLDGFNSGEIKRMVSTDCLAEGVDPKNLYVIINANWMQSDISVLQKAGRNRRLTDGKEFGVVIDFNDCWDERMTRKSKNRLKHYSTKGYKIFESSSPSKIEFVK